MNYFKKLFFPLLLLVGFQNAYAQDAASLIPGKSVMVMDFNLKKITEKVNYKAVEQYYWFNKMDYEIKKDFPEKYEQVSKIYKNPTAAGVDTTGHIYFAFYSDSGSFYPSLYVPIKDKKAFDKTFMAFESEKPDNLKVYKGIRYIAKRRELVIWNEKYFIFLQVPHSEVNSHYYEFAYKREGVYAEQEPELVVPDSTSETYYPPLPPPIEPDYESMEKAYYQEMESHIDRVLNLPANKSVLANNDFKAFKAKTSDVGMWVDLSVYADMFSERYMPYQGTYAPFLKLLNGTSKNSFVHAYLNFNKGEIVMDVENVMDGQLAKQTQKFYDNKFNTQLLNYFKKDSLVAFASMNMNSHEVYSYLSKETNMLTEKLSSLVTAELFRKEIRKDPQMAELDNKIDSLNKVLYPYYNYGYDENGDIYTADSTSAVEVPAYEEEAAVEAPAEEIPTVEESPKGKKKKKEKAPKEKKSKSKKAKKEEQVVAAEEAPAEMDYTDSYSGTEELSYDDQQKARTMLDSLYAAKDSIKKVIALKYLKENGLTEDDIWHFFKGDVAIGLTRLYFRDIIYMSYEYDEEMNSIPTETKRKELTPEYIVAATVDRKDKLETFLKLLESKGMLIKEGDIYKLVFNKNMPDNYVFVRDNIFFVTNRAHLALTNTKGYASSIANDPVMSKSIVSSPVYMSGDITKSTNVWADNTRRKENQEMIRAFGKNMSQFVYTSSYPSGNASSARFRIVMKDQSVNASVSIFRLIEGLYLAERVY